MTGLVAFISEQVCCADWLCFSGALPGHEDGEAAGAPARGN